MKYFLRLSCFAFMFGIYLAYSDLYMFVPKNGPPPPTCPPNEVFKICLSNCSNCEQRGFCVLRECRLNGCDCIPHFVRLTPGGPCEPVSKCPQPQCDENEVFRQCGPMCERCGTFNCKMVHCEHKCYCKEGYKRDETGKCIPQDECPPKTRCAREEEWRDSGFEDEYCLHEEGEIVSNSTVNATQCYCKEGFKRNGLGHCMEEKYCHIVKCSGPETYQNCPRRCNSTCRTYGDPDCVEDGQCYPGCFCPEGMYMNDFRLCVKLEHCPPGSNPYIPTLPPQEETTIPASVGEDLLQNETTTPATGGSEESENPANSEAIAEATAGAGASAEARAVASAEAVAVADAESGDGAEMPENLRGEDIESGDETGAGTQQSTDSTSPPKRRSSKRPKTRARAHSDASVQAEAEAALGAIREAGGDGKE